MQEMSLQAGIDASQGTGVVTDLFGQAGVFQNVTNMMLFIIGALAVIMIIVGGFRYVLSGGNSSSIAAAKNTILYAIIGVIVAICAYSIIQFVIGTFTGGSVGL